MIGRCDGQYGLMGVININCYLLCPVAREDGGVEVYGVTDGFIAEALERAISKHLSSRPYRFKIRRCGETGLLSTTQRRENICRCQEAEWREEDPTIGKDFCERLLQVDSVEVANRKRHAYEGWLWACR